MAALASIPEANSSLHSSFDAYRPRSRVVFLSRRPSKPRYFPRHSVFGRRPTPRSRHDDAPGKAVTDAQPCDGSVNSAKSNATTSSSWTKTTSKTAPIAPECPRKPEPLFDLSTFPKPPSNNSSIRPPRPSRKDACSHTIRHSPRKPPLALAQRKLLDLPQREPATARHSMRDAAIDLANPSKRQSVDSVLMTAVSRSIAQQFRLLSTLQHQTQRPPKSKSTFANNGSSGSSQKRRLNHYTKDLEEFAERVAARGKIVQDTPSPPADAATLRTVTELFPYRPQLRAAGLAVTSKEQAKSVPKYLENWQRRRPKTKQDGWRRRKVANVHAVQVDGHGSAGLSQSTGTEISFARPQNTDAVRLALIDEAPIRKKRRSERKKGKRRRCLPCFSARDDLSTDNDWAHFRAPSSKAVTGGQEKPSFLKGADRSARLPRPSECYTYSPPQSPRYMSGSKTAAGGDDETYSLGWDRPNFITTGRRYSMTAPRTATQSDARTARRQQTLGEESAREASQLPPSAIFHGEDSPRYHSVVSHHPTARPSVAHNVSSARRHKDYADAMRSSQTGQQQRPSKTSVLRPVPPPRLGPNHVGICCPQSRDVPAKLTARPNIPRRTSSMKGSIGSIDLDYDDGEIQDRDVLRGLHVAASAACNEEVDAFVRNRTGLRIRRFLADLMALETLTAARPGEDDAQHARRRRAEMRTLKKQVRRSREVALSGGLF